MSIGGVRAVMVTITPHENDLREETPAAVEIAKPKPINCIASFASVDRWDGSSHDDDNAT